MSHGRTLFASALLLVPLALTAAPAQANEDIMSVVNDEETCTDLVNRQFEVCARAESDGGWYDGGLTGDPYYWMKGDCSGSTTMNSPGFLLCEGRWNGALVAAKDCEWLTTGCAVALGTHQIPSPRSTAASWSVKAEACAGINEEVAAVGLTLEHGIVCVVHSHAKMLE